MAEKVVRDAYLTCTTEGHYKFYRMAILDNYKVIVMWGRIGNGAQQQVKQFTGISSANVFFTQKYGEKRAKGYKDAIDPTPNTFMAPEMVSTRKDWTPEDEIPETSTPTTPEPEKVPEVEFKDGSVIFK